jgi:hypothetical protein
MNINSIRRFSLILLVVCYYCMPLKVFSQNVTKFSGDSTKFIGELNMLFGTLSDNDQKITGKVMERFIQKWNSEQYDPAKKQVIYSICNQMLKKRLKPYPDFYNFISALDIFIDTHKPDPLFFEWSGVMQKLVSSKNSRMFLAFLDSSIPLFEENLIYKSLSTRWRISNPVYHILIDSVPIVTFSNSDLVGYSNRDTLTIMNTKGLYYPLNNRWVGIGGRVDWRRAGLDPAQVYAELHDYIIPVKFSKVVADSVDFYYKKYFSSPLQGRYIDKAQADIDEELASYPAFDSYDKDITIPGIFKNIDYLGGFAIQGAKIIGSGTPAKPAQLIFKKDDKILLNVHSKTFTFRPEMITSASASVSIYYEYDSIFHPDLFMKYFDEKKELTISRDEQSRVFSPWFDSFHKIEIYCEELSWKVGEPAMEFGMKRGPSQEGKAVFESTNYYTLNRYDKLQHIDEQNPLAVLKSFTEKKKKKEFSLEELCDFMQRPPVQVEAQLINLSSRGFLIYNLDKQTARINDKLIDYVNAKNNKSDYDVIYFNSDVVRKSNAILALDSFDLRIQGVQSIFLSDSQQVYIYPAKNEIILQKNRNFHFSGKIEAGLFDLYARNCFFEYGTFKLHLPVIDSMSFYVASRGIDAKTGKVGLVKVKTNINRLTGELLIDKPDNKAGLKNFPEYPVFISKNDAFVDWDKKYIQKGAYKKEGFFYKVYPFTFKGLSRFPTDSLKFKGYLSSSGIFPDLEQPLKVRPDFSLGIETKTDTGGLAIYGGKGRFINRIDLSNAGLHGEGKLVYLNSVTTSNDFIFFPDSMKTLARQFNVREMIAQVEYPSVHGDSVTELWLPYRDSLVISTSKWNFKKEMAMYGGQSKFTGNLSLSPNGLTGEGTVRIRDAEMDSRKFLFKQKTFDANIANFRIKSYDLADLSISTKNYQTHFDFENRKGEFKSNVGISIVEFPLNKYKCSMDRFDWLIDNEEIALYNDKNVKIAAADTMSLSQLINYEYAGSEFVSMHPKQDSLRFFALRARYNLKSNIINAEEVKIIKVADAAIFPDSGKVCILKSAQMKLLERAVIIANQKTQYHRFYDADVSVLSRKKYLASGIYDYIDRNSDHQPIRFARISVDTTGNTYAEGTIPDSVRFKLSPEFEYAGMVWLSAPDKNLTFEGGFRPLTDCLRYTKWWVRFKSVIDPKDIQLPVSRPLVDVHNEKIFLGIAYNNAESRIYPGFFIKKEIYNDSIMIAADGLLSYNIANNVFSVSTPEKARVPGAIYNTLALATEQCLIHMDGKINLNLNSGPMKMESYGTMNYYLIPDSVNARVAIAFNFPFSETAIDKFSQQVQSINLPGITVQGTPYYGAMKTLIGAKDFDKQKSDLEMLGKFKKFPEEITRTLFLADVSLKWDSVNNTWISHGPIGIGNIGKNQLNRYANGVVEFIKKKNGDDFTIYLELTKNDWYFLNYRNNILQVLSSNIEFNDLITNEQRSSSEKKRIDNIAKGFQIIISTDRKKREFLRKFQTEE